VSSALPTAAAGPAQREGGKLCCREHYKIPSTYVGEGGVLDIYFSSEKQAEIWKFLLPNF